MKATEARPPGLLRQSGINDPKRLCKDVSNVGHWGDGDAEVGLKSLDEQPCVMGLVRESSEIQTGDGDQA